MVTLPMRVHVKDDRFLDEKIPIKKLNALKKACNEFVRKDLYRPLSYVLNLNIRWLNSNLDQFLKARRYLFAANVMPYQSKTARARMFLKEALDQTKSGLV